MEPARDRLSDLIALCRNYRDRCIFLNTVDKKLDRFCRCHISQDRIHSRLDADEKSGRDKYQHVDDQYNVAYMKEIASPTDPQSSNFGPVKDGTSADRKSDPGTDK